MTDNSSNLSAIEVSRRCFLRRSALLGISACLAVGQRKAEAEENRPPFKIVWTFDDGTSSDYNVWAPMFGAANAKATFYVITSKVEAGKGVTKEQLLELQQSGHEIGSHSLTHPNLVKLLETDPGACEREIRESREKLLSWGVNVTSFAYPNGPHNSEVEALVKQAGYTNARCSEVVNWSKKQFEPTPPKNPFAWRIFGCTGLGTRTETLEEAFAGCRAAGGAWLGVLSHAAGDGPRLPGYYTHPQAVKDFIEWANTNGFIFTTVREAIGV